MKIMSMKLAEILAGNNKNLRENIDYIRYGIEIVLMSIIGVTGMIIISLVMNNRWGWIPFLISFALLRSSAGGYHAKSAINCLVISEFMFGIAMFAVTRIELGRIEYSIIYIFCLLVVFIFSPVEAKNKKLSSELKMKNRLKSFIYMGLNLIVLLHFENSTVKELYCLGMLFAAFSMVIAIINERRKQHEKDYV